MTDLSQALSEVKSLPDAALQKELSDPTGMIPGYIILGEMQERRSLRSSGTGEPKPSLAQEYIGKPFARGGMVTALNPFHSYTLGLKFQKMLATEPQLNSGISTLPELPVPGEPVGLETLLPLQPGEPQQPAPAQAYARGGVVNQYLTPYQKALLETISGPESAGRYNVMYGGSTFSDYSQHPGVGHRIQSGPNAGQTSSAAGKYQFLGSTWNDIAKRYGIQDFSPASQDLGAWHLAKENYARQTGGNLDTVLQSGDPNALAGVGKVLNSTWTSLPGGIEAGTNTNRFVNTFNQNLMGAPATLAEQTAAVAQQQASAGQFVDPIAIQGGQAAAQTAAAANPMSGIMGLMMMQQMMPKPKPVPVAAPAPPRFTQRTDPVVMTVQTSQTPDAYRRRRRKRG